MLTALITLEIVQELPPERADHFSADVDGTAGRHPIEAKPAQHHQVPAAGGVCGGPYEAREVSA